MNLIETLNKRSRAFLTASGFALLVLIWVIDYWTGPEFSSLLLYLVPVIFVTWFAGRWPGILLSVASSAAWLLTDAIARYPYPHMLIPLWSMVEKLGIFLIVVYILLKLSRQHKALEFERGQFLSILDTTDDLIYISNPESYEVLYVNNAITNLFGSDIVGKKCYEILQGMEMPCDFCTNKYIFGENTGKPYVWEYQNKSNQRWYRCIDRAIKWPDGKWVRYETAVDITESKKMESERKNILSMFAHDMKNPIIISEGFLSRLLSNKAGVLTEKQADYVGLVWGQLSKLERFISNFLEFSRIKSKEYKTDPLPFNIEAAIKEHVEAVRIETEKKNIKVIFEAPEDIIAVVNADAIQIERAIANLLDNAIKYTDPGGTVTVNLGDGDKDMLIQITDTGIGIPDKLVQHIFDAFYRVSRDSRGSGLGLSIVKTIVESNGGKIWVESIHGKGSTFKFTLPKYQNG
ncbi:alkaline phosphatase synthesis sensor protein PhoR [bacterium BMS3Abin09]|nr:alkaline phosphatase synthesis sensor protein PhoR [bacterium BMS3Abin09]GBE41423.1 alkaline phosphatase synthesis sensor protein PhoR [bacterium BMS3Bbin09]